MSAIICSTAILSMDVHSSSVTIILHNEAIQISICDVEIKVPKVMGLQR
ncbi:MAG: hypothetical protein ACTS8R_05485 [Arsenophonus sp. NC-QC1-MAG3]